jgi:hypothetical protein
MRGRVKRGSSWRRLPLPHRHEPLLKRWPRHQRRERRLRLKEDAEVNKLALRPRLAVLAAGELDARSIRAVFAQLKDQAINGHGHVQIQAARLLFDLANGTVEDMPRDPEDTPFQEMTPGERAALLAKLNKLLEEEPQQDSTG